MSRANYSDDVDSSRLNVWRGAVASAIRGKRGQAFLQELADAMDAMPDKRLISHAGSVDGCMCTLAVVASVRGLDMDRLNHLMEEADTDSIASMLGIADAMAREIMFENDEGVGDSYWLGGGYYNYPHPSIKTIEEKRWSAMRAWVSAHLAAPTAAKPKLPEVV